MDPPSLSKDAATEPDIMNDPAYDTNTQGRQKGTEEPDTCRICRGEGSKEEPLFYPCKCSGSIKFVHQGCLLEWLSHSQKKHCELCKTSFRFTKLYHPQMPSTVPMTIFMKRAALHTLRSLLTWARWNLVTFVWLIWVPWCMRTVWRGLFWIGDGGWATQYGFQRQTTQSRPDLSSITTTTSGGHSTATDTYHPLRGLTLGWSPISQTLNFSSAEPNMVRIAKKLSGWLFYAKFYSDRVDNSTATTNSSAAISQRSPSLLSDLNFLKALTRWHTLNNLIIDVLEGQLITLCVVIAFILIFLIREWVVQQQPAINMGANMDIGARDIEDELEETDAEDGDDEDEERSDEGSNEQDELPELEPVRDTEQQMEVERRERPIARARVARHLRRPLEPTGDDQQRSNTQGQQAELHSTEIDHNDSQLLQSGDPTQQPTITGPGPSSLAQRPTLPTRDALARATEIQRTLEEQSRTSGKDWPGLDVFMDLWKRADSNPSGVLTLIQQEGRQDELGWIVAAMERLEAADGKLPVGSRFGNKELPNEQLSEKSDGSWQSVNNRDGSDAGGIESEEQVSVLIENPLGSKSASLPITTPEHHSSPDYEETNPPSKVSLPVGSQGISEISSITQDSSPLQSPVDPQNSHERPSSYVDPVASHDADEHMATSDLTADIHEPLLSTSDDANPAEHHNDQSTAVTHSNDDHGQDQQPAQNLSEAIKNWLWGGVPIQIPLAEDPGEDVEHIVEDVANEAPFMPVAQGQLVINDANAPVAPVVVAVEAAAEAVPAEHNEIQQDPDVLRAAAEAGIDPDDPEAVEDGEDLEGVMELIGMQGPLAGLFQNGMFSAVLISLSIFFGLWIPYISGKALLVFLANPISLTFKLPLRWASTIADIILDVCIFVAGCAFYWIDAVVRLVCSPVGWLIPCIGRIQQNKHVPETVKGVIWKAGERLSKSFIATGGQFSDSDIPVFSVIAHEALNNIECKVTNATRVVFHGIQTVAETPIYDIITLGKIKALIETLANTAILAFYTLIQMIQRMVSGVPSLLLINPLRISLDIPRREEPLDYSLAYWNTRDRILAIILGYILFCAGGALYLRIRNTFRDNQEEDKADGPFVEILNQAGGVIKVILIISIEMIVFPLYCGMLLDIALLPLFDKATIVSRLRFTASSPATSLFVHWFVGTCYMFHFALFVSMCRKIMRTGVLYFIRDPDDPAFHPVRDVLERNVYTQLRKIAFSAMVYGALVMVCLGTVVWGIAYVFKGVFPIHWSSNEPVLEFPVDLLVYNSLMPIVIKFFKPSKGLTAMYKWWFQKCARALRLSHFLFNAREKDEEGHWKKSSSVGDSSQDSVWVPDGRYVRAPASDQVRIPKGGTAFIDVDEYNERKDGKPDTEQGLHGRQNKMFSLVFIPPHFRCRIAAFIVLLWLFAATTGVGTTIIPLLFGRRVFTYLIPSHLRMNDLYAFAIGIYLLGGPIYLVAQHHKKIISSFRKLIYEPPTKLSAFRRLLSRAYHVSIRGLRLFYFYGAFTLLLPSMVALLFETFFLIPLHTYFFRTENPPPPHTIHFIQDWTLGVLYVRVATRIILFYRTSRPAQALRATVSSSNNGASYWNPDIRLATRAFIFPASVLMITALLFPLGFGWLVNTFWFRGADDGMRATVYRYSFPALLAIGLVFAIAKLIRAAVHGWRARIKDEVYLIGERLHNFGDQQKRPSVNRVATR